MGAEAVLFTPAVGLAILRVVSLLLIPAVALAGVCGVAGGTGHSRLARFIDIAALAIGVLFAPPLLIASSTDAILGLSDIFRAHGPWDLSFAQFLTRRALPLLLSPVELVHAVVTGRASADVVRGTIFLGAAVIALAMGPVVALRNRTGVVTGVRNLLLVLWGAYATIYTVAILLWLANILNFWCFLVLFAATLLVHD
jgi:hypothetical protein